MDLNQLNNVHFWSLAQNLKGFVFKFLFNFL